MPETHADRADERGADGRGADRHRDTSLSAVERGADKRRAVEQGADQRRAGQRGANEWRGAQVCLVLCAAPWALPSRPGPRLVEELGRMWDGGIATRVLDPPSAEQQEAFGITAYPTWIVLAADPVARVVTEHTAKNVDDDPWIRPGADHMHRPAELGRRVGALAKHTVRTWVEELVTEHGERNRQG